MKKMSVLLLYYFPDLFGETLRLLVDGECFYFTRLLPLRRDLTFILIFCAVLHIIVQC